MLNKNFDFITKMTVSITQFIYHLLVQNFYFISSNILFLIFLFLFRFNLNNFILFTIPIFFLLVSISTQFKLISYKDETISLKKYISVFRIILYNNWLVYAAYTTLITFIVFDFHILLISNMKMMLYPLAITGCFLLNSMLFVLLILTDQRVKKISFKRIVFWSLSISYRLPIVTVCNIGYLLLVFFCLQNFSLAYLCFIGGGINYFIYLNLSRRFSLELFFKQIFSK